MGGMFGEIRVQHNFVESLDFSHRNADDPMWEEVYRNSFPAFESMACIKNDGWAQRGGIDRVVTLSSGKVLHFDEKIRKKDYGDILLEYWSNEERKVRGWVAKDLACDYIAYAFLPSKTCYLLPFQQLRLAWKANAKDWVKKYRRVEANNGCYVTVSVPVPTEILLKAISNAMVCKWQQGSTQNTPKQQ